MQRLGITDKNPTKPMEVAWVKGALLMIRKELFERLKGFDEEICMYTEDMELCYRAKEIGEKVYFYPTKDILHKDQGSSNRTFAIINIYKGILYFYKKHMPAWQMHFVRALLISKATILVIVGTITHNTYLSSTYAQALTVLR
jgi:GT2 family glycosyltransferase